MIKRSLVFLIAMLIFSCNPIIKSPNINTLPHKDGKYDSEFPILPTAPYLQQIIQSVKMVSILTFYRAYEFALKDSITLNDIHSGTFKSKAIRAYIYEQPAAGTVTAIHQTDKKILFLTCNHIVSQEDTIITYYASKKNPDRSSKYIYSFSRKIRQITNLISLPKSSEPKILATNKKNDLALLSITLHKRPKFPFPVFPFSFGRASQLQWGTFIYLIGFPKGKLLLTSSVVSEPNRDKKHNFLINATLARGISGGIIIALRDGPPHFELVGMANALSAHIQYYLKPETHEKNTFMDLFNPYKGKIFIGRRMAEDSNIVFAISAETIIKFIKENLPLLKKEGFFFSKGFPQQVK